MPDTPADTGLDATIAAGRRGDVPVERVLSALLDSELFVLTPAGETPSPQNLDPLVVHREEQTFLAAFTAPTRVPRGFADDRVAVGLPARVLLAGMDAHIGLVVNPGTEGFEIPGPALRALAASSLAGAQPSQVRYLMRQHVIDGTLIPTTLLRRTVDAEGTRDEVFRGPGRWTPDVRGTVDRALRFPLDSDLEEITEQQALEIQRSIGPER